MTRTDKPRQLGKVAAAQLHLGIGGRSYALEMNGALPVPSTQLAPGQRGEAMLQAPYINKLAATKLKELLPSSVVLENTAGDAHTCGIRQVDGQAMCWGYNWFGQLGDGTNSNKYTPVSVSDVTVFTQISVGGYHTCGIRQDGQAMCWGSNGDGNLGDGTNLNKNTPVSVYGGVVFTQISAGRVHTVGLQS